MFLVDDILLSPLKGFASICSRIEQAAREDLENQKQEVLEALGRLHEQIESGAIDDEEFDERESTLLDRYDAIEKTLSGG